MKKKMTKIQKSFVFTSVCTQISDLIGTMNTNNRKFDFKIMFYYFLLKILLLVSMKKTYLTTHCYTNGSRC